MNIKKGFTLIELLAVIIILGLLVLISTPKLRNIINDSKSKVREQDVQLFLKALRNEIYAKNLKGKFNPSSCVVEDSIVTCDGTNIDMEKSKNNINGTVYIENNEIKNYNLMIGKVQYTNIEYTDERCFDIVIEGDHAVINKYYNYIDNDSNNEVCPKDVIIPYIYEGRYITEIGDEAFGGRINKIKITSVIIPNNVTSIGENAFAYNKLTGVIIPDGITRIEDGAFMSNQLTSIKIPDSVIEIGNSAFFNNKLTSIVIPNKVTTIGPSAFERNELVSVIIPDSVTTIGVSSFSRNQITNLELGHNIEKIELATFASNFLENLIIPDNVTFIDERAFECNRLTSVEIGTQNSKISYIGDGAFGNSINNYGYGPNAITSIRIHKTEDSYDYDLWQSGLTSYGVEIQWDE